MDDEHRSHVERLRRPADASTRLAPLGPEPRLEAGELADAWSALVPGLSLVPGAQASAYRLFWTRRGNTGFRDFPLEEGAHLVMGRHSMSDVVLGDDPELSLRHLLVTAMPGDRAIRLVDLMTFVPLYLDDERAHRALVLRGPFALRLGRYVVGGFPIGRDVPAPPAVLPIPEIVADDEPRDAPRAPGPPAVGEGPYRDAHRRSVITLMPRPITLVETSSVPASEAALLLTAARAGERVRVTISPRELRAGVLVGRHDKCTDRGLKPLLTDGVSRVHVVLIDTLEGPRLYDTASTNGTFVDGTRLRGLAIRPETPVVRLAGRGGPELRLTHLKPLGAGGR